MSKSRSKRTYVADHRTRGNRAARRGNKGYDIQENMGAEHPNARAERLMKKRQELLEKRRNRNKRELAEAVKEVQEVMAHPVLDEMRSMLDPHLQGTVQQKHWKKDEPGPPPEPEEIPPEIAKLEENLEPRRKSRVVERGYERNHKLVGLTKRRAGYRCEVEGCTTELFTKPDGKPYVEVHHLIMMAEGGPDTLENMVCLCPNHHRELHYGKNKKKLKRQLQILRAEADNV